MGQCPSSFANIPGGCVAQCPTDKGFEQRMVNTQPQCVYKADPTRTVSLQPMEYATFSWGQPGQPPPAAPTLESLRTTQPDKHARYIAEQTRVNEQITILLAAIDKDTKLANAFRELQTAENARDTAPTAYQQARTNYYTLLKGDDWKLEEQERIARSEVDPEIARYRSAYREVNARTYQQQKTLDIINGLKQNVLTIKDDFKYSVDTLQRQLGKLRDQIVYDKRKREIQSKDNLWDILDRVLNYLIVAVLLFAIWKLYGVFSAKASKVALTPTASPVQ